jgi:hypothetical protein
VTILRRRRWVPAGAAAFLFALVLLGALLPAGTSSVNTAVLASHHVDHYGVRFPSAEFGDALQSAALDISGESYERYASKTLVLLAMANDAALNTTVPLFLEGLSRIKGLNQATLDAHLALVVWSRADMDACSGLQEAYKHQCVRDAEHKNSAGSHGFHSPGFHALGFAKIK